MNSDIVAEGILKAAIYMCLGGGFCALLYLLTRLVWHRIEDGEERKRREACRAKLECQKWLDSSRVLGGQTPTTFRKRLPAMAGAVR